jgi:hypothetical protein
MRKIKKVNAQQNKIKVPSGNSFELDYPIFCFRYLQTEAKRDFKFYADFVERLKKISSLTWHQINIAERHGFGTEKMPITQIKPLLPRFVTPDVTHLLVFRANADNRPFLGLRSGIIFHIIFIEEQFGDVYDHS